MKHLATLRTDPLPSKPARWARWATYLPPGNALEDGASVALKVGERYWPVTYHITSMWTSGAPKRVECFSRWLSDSEGLEDLAIVADPPSLEQWTLAPEVPTGSWRLYVEEQQRDQATEITFANPKVLRQLGPYQALRYRTRGPGGLWFELYAELSEGATEVPSALRITWSDRSTERTWAELGLSVYLHLEGVSMKVGDAMDKRFPGELRFGEVNDGQGAAVAFDLCYTSGDHNLHRVHAWQLDAIQGGGFGLLGRPVSLALLGSPSDADAVARGVIDSIQPGCWEAGTTQPAESGTTGEHGAFGLVSPAGWLLYGSPKWLEVAQYNCYAEAARPIWIRNDAGEPVTHAETKNVLWWGERPFPAAGYSMLGKDGDINPYLHGARTNGGSIWTGLDEQHAEDPNLVAYPALTMDPCAEDMLRERMQRWMGCLRVDTGNETVDGVGSGRAARLLGMLALATEFEALPEALRVLQENVRAHHKEWSNTSPGSDVYAQVMPQQVYGPSLQAGGLWVDHWRPWEDLEASKALLRVYAIDGMPDRDLALALSSVFGANAAIHGLEVFKGTGENEVETYRLFTALAFLPGGVPLSEAQKADPRLALTGAGAGYMRWGYAGFVCAMNAAIMVAGSDPARQALARPVIQRCARIMRQLMAEQPTCWTSSTASVRTSGEASEWFAIEALPVPEWALPL